MKGLFKRGRVVETIATFALTTAPWIAGCPGVPDSKDVEFPGTVTTVPGECHTEGVCNYSDPACESPTGYPYLASSFCRGDVQQFDVYWETFGARLHHDGDPLLTRHERRAAAAAAWSRGVDRWFSGSEAPQFLPVTNAIAGTAVNGANDGVSVVFFTPFPASDLALLDTGAGVLCRTEASNACHNRECTVVYFGTVAGREVDWATDDASLRGREVSLELVTTHEVGHVMGLGHWGAADSVMQPRFYAGTPAFAPSADDLRAVLSIYGPR